MLKIFEIRDRATFIPVFAFRCRPAPEAGEAERYLYARAGYGPPGDSPCIMVGTLENPRCNYNAYNWGHARTMIVAHNYINEQFDALESGAVIDVEFILGETAAPRTSERQALYLFGNSHFHENQ